MTIPTHPTGQVLAAHPVRSLFLTDPDTVIADSLVPELHRIGVAHLEFQVYPGVQPIETNQWDAAILPKIRWCRRNKFRIVGLGDNAFKTSYRQQESIVRHAAKKLRESGIVDGIEMVDESHNNPAEYKANEYRRWWREEGGPPMAWPGMVPYRMETDELSDYSSRYWPAYLTPTRDMTDICHQMMGAMAKLRKDRPCNLLVSCADSSYRGTTLVYAGVNPNQILTQCWIAMALGASGVRVWAYDWSPWRQSRAAHAPGQQQTGSRPGDGERWEGVAAAFLSLKKYDAALRLPCYEPVRSGPWLWGRRGHAGQGAFVWCVNVSNHPQPSPHGPGQVPSGGVRCWDMLELMRGNQVPHGSGQCGNGPIKTHGEARAIRRGIPD